MTGIVTESRPADKPSDPGVNHPSPEGKARKKRESTGIVIPLQCIGPAPFVIRLVLPQLFAVALPGRVPHGQDMQRLAPDGKQDAVFPMPLAVEQHPDFLAESVGVGIDRTTLGIGFQRFDPGPDATNQPQGFRRGFRLILNPLGRRPDVAFRPWLDDDSVDHGRALNRSFFSRASKTSSIGRPSPRSTEASPSLTASMVSSRSARSSSR
jgi:hypothetical protein